MCLVITLVTETLKQQAEHKENKQRAKAYKQAGLWEDSVLIRKVATAPHFYSTI